MRLPLQKQTDAQRRQAVRRLIWSLCLAAPNSLLIADDNADKKAEPKAVPVLTLPTFPSSLPPSVTTQPAHAQPVASQSEKRVPATTPPMLAVPVSSTSPASVSTLAPAPSVAPASAAKPVTSSVAKSNPNDTKINVRVAADGQEPVSIKFGGQGAPSAPGVPQSATSSSAGPDNAKLNQAPASFRLSDKPVSAPQKAAVAPTMTQAPALAQAPAQTPATASKVLPPSAATLLKATDTKNVSAKLPAAPVQNTKAAPSAKTVDAAIPSDIKPEVSRPIAPKEADNAVTPMGSLTVAPSGIKPSSPEKNELKRDAILIRPKAIVLGQQPSALAGNREGLDAKPISESNAPADKTQVAAVKPSTTPQFVAGKTEDTTSHKMKGVDSKVSALPPSQQPELYAKPANIGAAPNLPTVPNLPTAPMIIAAVPLDVAETNSDVPKVSGVAKVATPTVPSPAIATPAIAMNAPSIARPSGPEAIAVEDRESINLAVSSDLVPPVVVDAKKIAEATLAAVKKYSKPADRRIQVGTVALTTFRVGEKDVIKCEVDDTSVCRAIVTADGEVALLPGKVGVTRATLWIEEANGEPKVETADIQVGEILPLEKTAAVEISKLNENIQRLYPNTTLRVVPSDRCIEICGEADTEQQAREVLQLIRKLCLVPVKDKIIVR